MQPTENCWAVKKLKYGSWCRACSACETPFDVYKSFFEWIGKPTMFRMMHGMKLEFADVFHAIYCKIGLGAFSRPTILNTCWWMRCRTIRLFNMLFFLACSSARKLILGDVQSACKSGHNASSAEGVNKVFSRKATSLNCLSYHFARQIAQFSLRSPIKLIAMERHGEEPQVISFANTNESSMHFSKCLKILRSRLTNRWGIICKNTATSGIYLKN